MLSPNIRKRFNKVLLNRKKYPIPNPFCYNQRNIKAIVLGTDPRSNSYSDSADLQQNVFGIGSGDNKIFKNIYTNLNCIGLNLEEIYVQNVIPFFLVKNLSVNLLWNELAEAILPSLISELDSIDKKRQIPVLLSSEIIYTFLLKDFDDYLKPRELYNNCELLPIAKLKNKLGRKLYPIYQKKNYSLAKEENKKYAEFLKGEFIA